MTTEEAPLVSLLEEPIWVLQARDGTKIMFDPDPIATEGWDQLFQLKAELANPATDTKGSDVLDRLHTILGSFCVDTESCKAWKASLKDLGLNKTLTLMKNYVEKVQGDDGLPT